jgi:predicted regulator of Ras-like GTPase activity (Roadblock/LC7/MglB family)
LFVGVVQADLFGNDIARQFRRMLADIFGLAGRAMANLGEISELVVDFV